MTNKLNSVIAARSRRPDIKEALMGGLLTLDDSQVRDRAGQGSSRFDWCESKDGYSPTFQANLPFGSQALTLPTIQKLRNERGEWTTEVHLKPLQWGSDRAIITCPDSNAFVPAATAYPLYLFNEHRLLPNQRLVTPMRQQALNNVKSYRSPRGGYNFWPRRSGGAGVQPHNLPVQLLDQPLARKLLTVLGIGPADWIEKVSNPALNPGGSRQLTNIPDDADDTSIAVAVQEMARRAGEGAGDGQSMLRLAGYRDQDRTTPREPDEQWQGTNTGAYLTWLAPERNDPFADDGQGILPLGKNDVGPVVNANALLALGLTGQTNLPGFSQAANLVVRTIEEKRWQGGTRYYPQPAVFPYCVARAWRDGGIRAPGLDTALATLMRDLLEQQAQDGSFPGCPTGPDTSLTGGTGDRSRALSTAMSVVALLNLGRSMACSQGLERQYDEALESGIDYLLDSSRTCPLVNSPEQAFGRSWEPGVFFSGSPFAGYWRSEGYTVGVVVEALTRYVTATDWGGPQREICPQAYARSAERAAQEFRFSVEPACQNLSGRFHSKRVDCHHELP
ncbi:MAG: hypothetical protein U0931_21365 [Vulcanimicrobiota bacterium]